MTDEIAQALGSEYRMYYHPALSLDHMVPGADLEQCVEVANQLLDRYGSNLLSWDPAHHDTMARLMYVNWMATRLTQEPIRKPVLLHWQHGQLHVDCGDTRIMALTVMQLKTVSAVVTTKGQFFDSGPGWVEIRTQDQLLHSAGFDPNTGFVLVSTVSGQDWCVDWLEIGDQSTQHHLHDVVARTMMLNNWLSTQQAGFRFDRAWMSQPIEWSQFL